MATSPLDLPCFGHPGVPAAARCGSCGRAACDVCAMPGIAGVRCPACWARRIPWEDRARLGGGRAFALTLRGSLFAPHELFARLARPGPVRPALRYALWTHAIGVSTAAAFAAVGAAQLGAASQLSPLERVFAAVFLLSVLSTLWVVGDVVLAVLIHACLALLGGARGGLRATVRAVCYAGGAGVLWATVVLPYFFVPQAWAAVSAIHAVREAHGTTRGRATTAVVVPSLGCALALFAIFQMVGRAYLKQAGA